MRNGQVFTFVLVAVVFVAMVGPARAELCIKDGETIAFMGDSITARGFHAAGYCVMLGKAFEVLGVKNVHAIPAGKIGDKSNQMRTRLERDVLSRKPQWMTFSCGVNDVWHGKNGVELEKFCENVTDILDRAAAKGVKVIVLTPTLIREDPTNAENLKLDNYVAWLKDEAARRNLPLVDLNAAMKAELARICETDKTTGNKLTYDGVHMIYPGNRMIAWNILRTLGVEEHDRDLVFAAWSEMKNAYEVKSGYSANEWEIISARAAKEGKTVEAFARDSILKAAGGLAR